MVAAGALAAVHPCVEWACPICVPGWRPGPDDPPVEEIWQSRNCKRLASGGQNLDLTFAPNCTECPRRAIAEQSQALDAWLLWREFGGLPLGAAHVGALPLPLVDALLACQAGSRRAVRLTQEREQQEQHRTLAKRR